MNNRQGMMTTLLTVGAAGAAIYGITRGVQNGTFQRLPQTVTNAMNSPTAQQMTQAFQNMTANQNQNAQLPANTQQAATSNLQQMNSANQEIPFS